MATPAFKFGSFDYFCNQAALTVCPLVGAQIEPECYARNVEISNQLIFQPATLVIYVIAIVMTSIMIYHIKSKYTAVGRKEIVIFFYMYMGTVVLEFLLVSGIIPTASSVYPYFAAGLGALTSASFWCLLLNGFVGFQWAEDGTPLSLWSIRLSSLLIFGIVYFISIGTFLNYAGLAANRPTGIFVVWFIFDTACIIVYVLLQIVLVLNTLEDRWPLGDILFGFLFFIIGLIFLYILSTTICESAKHYIDGIFFVTIFTLLGVMMVYKYWDSITKEDLEFSVGGKANVWEIKDPLLSDEQMMLLANEHQRMQAELAMGGNGISSPPQ
ncbi:chitin synthase III catalytic subunit [Hyaloraphidium curvatum]|nr:chitin synthase III catalytic subunit [Hyaloraphidium curvatum]